MYQVTYLPRKDRGPTAHSVLNFKKSTISDECLGDSFFL